MSVRRATMHAWCALQLFTHFQALWHDQIMLGAFAEHCAASAS